jgi:pimeloyl-ACP methyl ester carboxylesterase
VRKVVFVHGVPDTFRLWDPIIERLDDIVPNALALPGFDWPVSPGFGATKEEYVDWVIESVEDIGGPVDLVGHDWGSLIVQRVASLRPDLITTWVVGDAAIDAEYEWHDTAKLWQTPDVGEQVMDAFTPEAMVAALGPQGIPEATALEMSRYMDATMKDCILKLYRSAVNIGAEWEGDLQHAASRPSLIIWGKDDPYVPVRYAERLAERVAGELVVLDSRHWWPVERPAEAAAAMTEFWDRN